MNSTAKGQLTISVVIVSYNSGAYLPACLRSLKDQSIEAIDIIIVDNASGDDSVPIARQEAPDANVLALNDNVGFASANNIGIRNSKADLVLLLNPDCELRPGSLSTLLDFATAHPDAGATGPKLLNPDGTLQPSGRRFPTLGCWFVETTGLYRLKTDNPNLDMSRDYNQSCEVDEVSGACMLLRREALEQVGGLDETFFLLWEDVDLCKRLHDACWKIYYCADARVVHHFGASRKQVTDLVRRASMQSAERYFRKHHGLFAFGFVKLVHIAKEFLRHFLSLPLGGRGERG